MERGLTSKEEILYEKLMSFINDCLEDETYTINCLINAIDELVDELLATNEEGLW